MLKLLGLYALFLSTSLSLSPLLPVGFQSVICQPLLTHLTHSSTSVIMLEILTCCGFIPSAGRYLAPAEVVCVLNSLLDLVVTSAVVSCLCEQHLLSGFLFRNKPKLRYEPERIYRLPPKKSHDKNFHFVVYVGSFEKEVMSLLLTSLFLQGT